LRIYPLKGAQGIAVQDWTIDALGLRLDRRWMLVDSGARAINQKTNPLIALVGLSLDGEALRFNARGMSELCVSGSEDKASPSIMVDSMGSEVSARIVPGDASRWFGEFLGVSCTLVYMPDDSERWVDPAYAPNQRTSFTNGYPVHLITRESVDLLNTRLEVAVGMERFRPNMIVAGGEPHQDDSWRRIRIGDVEFDVVKPCDHRCGMLNIDPETAERGTEPVRTLAGYRKRGGWIAFGQNLVPAGTGRITAPQPIEVLERGSPRLPPE